MEAFVLSEIEAIQHVVVAGVGRQYLACLLTLKTVPGTHDLSDSALAFVAAAGMSTHLIEFCIILHEIVYDHCGCLSLKDFPSFKYDVDI